MRSMAFLLVLLLASTANANVDSLQQPIVDGDLTTRELSTVAIVLTTPSLWAPFCSGVVVGKRTVLTAAHCVGGINAHDLTIVYGSDAGNRNNITRKVARVIVHESWHDGANHDDIAILRLEEDSLSRPVKILSDNVEEITVRKARAKLVGFGRTTDDDDIWDHGQKRVGYGRIVGYGSSALRITDDPSIACNGDSGGPTYVKMEDGSWALIGLQVRSDCDNVMASERIDIHLSDFIIQQMERYGESPRLVSTCVGNNCYLLADSGCSVSGSSNLSSSLVVLLALFMVGYRKWE